MSGSPRWPATAWRNLLELALSVLEDAGNPRWTFGGGSALALKLGHRVSYDVDIFVEDAGLLRELSPNRNVAARAVSGLWQEPGNYLKLEREEGEIDFILAAYQTELMPWLMPFGRRRVPVEPPGEILAKKLRYRGSRLLPRDVFDILAVERFDPAQVQVAVRAAPEGARRAADRIRRIAPRYRRTIALEVNPTTSGAELLELAPERAAELLERQSG